MLATSPTSTSTIFDHAVENGSVSDDAIRRTAGEGDSGETSVSEPTVEDLHVDEQAIRRQLRRGRTRFERRRLIARLHHRSLAGTADSDTQGPPRSGFVGDGGSLDRREGP